MSGLVSWIVSLNAFKTKEGPGYSLSPQTNSVTYTRGSTLPSRSVDNFRFLAEPEYKSKMLVWQYTPRRKVKAAMEKRSFPPPPPGFRYIFRPARKCPITGQTLFARAFGFKAWPILIAE